MSDTLVGLVRRILVGKPSGTPCGTLLKDTLACHSWDNRWTLLLNTLVEHSCGTLCTLAGTLLWDTIVRRICLSAYDSLSLVGPITPN